MRPLSPRRWPVLLAAGAGLACLVAGSALLLTGAGAADVGVVPPVVVSALPPPQAPGTTPVAVEIPGRAVRAPVVPVGTAATGAMELPADPRTVGWWSPGPLVGGRGAAVLAGHVDTAEIGLGALAVLREVEPGEEVVVRGADGRELRYVVAARREYRKADLPADLFTRDGPPGLVLITCGGAFDRATGHYEDNVVVHAVPA